MTQRASTPKVGAAFRYNDTPTVYVVEDVLTVKINGNWACDGCVVYSNEDGFKYVRLIDDFLGNFTEVTE